MPESFEDITPRIFTLAPTAWETLGFAEKFSHLPPESAVAAKAIELYTELCGAGAEYDHTCEAVQQGYEEEGLGDSKLRYSLTRVIHSQRRYDTFRYLYSGIYSRVQLLKRDKIHIDYDEVVEQACDDELHEIKRDSRLTETATLDLTKLTAEIGTLYRDEPGCLVFGDSETVL